MDSAQIEAYKFRTKMRLLVLLAVAILMTGWGAAGLLGIRAVKLGTSLQLVEAPGTAIVNLDRSGQFTIYHEFQGVMNNQYYFQGRVAKELNVEIVKALTSETLPLTPGNPGLGYRFGARRGGELVHFTVPEPGDYRIASSYTGELTTQTMLAIGDGRERTITRSLVAMWTLTLLTTAVATMLAVYALTRR